MKAISPILRIISIYGLMLPAICLADPGGTQTAAGDSHADKSAGAQPASHAGSDHSTSDKSTDTKQSGGNASSNGQDPRPGGAADNSMPVSQFLPHHKPPGKGLAKPAAGPAQGKSTPTPVATTVDSKKAPARPMAAAEAASTQKKAISQNPPMAAAEASSNAKKAVVSHELEPKDNVIKETPPEKIIARVTPVVSRQPGSSLNGTSSVAPRGKTPPLAAIDGSKISRIGKGAASVTGTSMR